jgi:V-type H+-transporting ATPase subunit d
MGNKDLNTTAKISVTRSELSPTMGYLFPDCSEKIMTCTTLDSLREAVKGISNYRDILKDAPDPAKREEFTFEKETLDDIMYKEETRRYSLAFDQAC